MSAIITLETGQVADIPILASLPTRSQPCPVVFYVCGYGGTKADGLTLAYRLAQAGMACISFDPLYHGDRYDPRLDHAADPALGGIYPPETGLDTGVAFFQVIRQAGLDIATLLRHFTGDPRLDTARAGVTGVSLGGYVSFLAFAALPALRAAVPMMSIPTFSRRWRDLLDECAWSNPAWAAALAALGDAPQRHADFIAGFDPAQTLLQAAPRALLAMNGDFDHDQPKSYTLGWYAGMRAAYIACPQHLQWNVYPVGHTVTEQMERDAVAWFVRYLAL
jgi:hypothetical protein